MTWYSCLDGCSCSVFWKPYIICGGSTLWECIFGTHERNNQLHQKRTQPLWSFARKHFSSEKYYQCNKEWWSHPINQKLIKKNSVCWAATPFNDLDSNLPCDLICSGIWPPCARVVCISGPRYRLGGVHIKISYNRIWEKGKLLRVFQIQKS